MCTVHNIFITNSTSNFNKNTTGFCSLYLLSFIYKKYKNMHNSICSVCSRLSLTIETVKSARLIYHFNHVFQYIHITHSEIKSERR